MSISHYTAERGLAATEKAVMAAKEKTDVSVMR